MGLCHGTSFQRGEKIIKEAVRERVSSVKWKKERVGNDSAL